MYSYSYFTSPTNDTVHEFCKKCTSSYGCVCDLLVQHGHCPTCMDPPAKCLCKKQSTLQTTPNTPLNGYADANLSWAPGPRRVDPVAQQAKEMLEQLQNTPYFVNTVATTPVTTTPMSWTVPVVKDPAKWTMNYFWKEACNAEGVPFTRKEHCAYPRVLATYHRLRKEYDEQGEKLVKELSSGW